MPIPLSDATTTTTLSRLTAHFSDPNNQGPTDNPLLWTTKEMADLLHYPGPPSTDYRRMFNTLVHMVELHLLEKHNLGKEVGWYVPETSSLRENA